MEVSGGGCGGSWRAPVWQSAVVCTVQCVCGGPRPHPRQPVCSLVSLQHRKEEFLLLPVLVAFLFIE